MIQKKQIFFIFLLTLIWVNSVFADRLKDLVSVGGVRTNQLIGYGLVVGLQGTGDGGDEAVAAAVPLLPYTERLGRREGGGRLRE